MTEILHSPAQLPLSSNSITSNNDGFHQQAYETLINCSNSPVATMYRRNRSVQELETEEGSLLAAFVTVFRKSLLSCKNISVENQLMEIGCPTNVRHIAHVTFDRFNGFLGLPVEFEPEVPRRPPSASTRVFGVSTQSMQLSFDSRGNCVPTILLMMQRRLYSQGGLQLEGIFRINPENGQEEYVREQLNNGLIPDNIDVHCLAGLIKAWFRELPSGILDSVPSDDVMQAKSEDECACVARSLPQTEAALLDWAINLMADVAQLEHLNKMNARNIAMVFAPNMTQMSDPLTALMYAVQVMNFLQTLVVKTLRERRDSDIDNDPMLQFEPSDEDSHQEISEPINPESDNEEDIVNIAEEPNVDISEAKTSNKLHGFLNSIENILPDRNTASGSGGSQPRSRKTKMESPNSSNSAKKGSRTHGLVPQMINGNDGAEKSKEISIINCVSSYTERVEAWR